MTGSVAAFPRTLTGVALVASAVVLVVWSLLAFGIDFPEGGRERLLLYATQRDRILANAMLFIALQIALLPAVLGMVHLARGRAPRLAYGGGILAVLGIVGHLVFSGSELTGVAIAELGTAPELVAAFEHATRSPSILPFMAAGLLGTFVGFPLLAAAVWRSRTVPTFIPALVLFGIVVEFVAGFTGLPLVGDLGTAAFAIGLGALGVRVLATTSTARSDGALAAR